MVEAYGTGKLRIMETYSGFDITPKMEISDNAFKIIFPNLNAYAKPKKAVADRPMGGVQDVKSGNIYICILE